ncbi:MAG: serine/threonine-protein kinase [Enhygromyxa sp.]
MAEGPDSVGLRDALSDLAAQPHDELRRARAHAHHALFGDDDEQPSSVGRYRLLANIGRGGLGDVWAAHDPHLDRTVALKLLRDDALRRHPRARAQLLAEAAIMARLTHPNVVRVYDLGDAEGELYVAMEYVEGRTLRDWQAEPHDWRAILAVYQQAGSGLAAAHTEGLVHGDFKPDNVLIGADGRVLVSDFAVAHHLLAAHVALEAEAPTAQGDRAIGGTNTLRDSSISAVAAAVVGTPAYMAPEQLDGRVPDARADQFSFCVTLWEALFGDRPFPGATWSQLRTAIRSGPPPELERPRGMPARLLAILRRGLAELPEHRYPDLDALLAELHELMTRPRRVAIALASIALVLIAGAGLAHGLLESAWSDDEQSPSLELGRQLAGASELQRAQREAGAGAEALGGVEALRSSVDLGGHERVLALVERSVLLADALDDPRVAFAGRLIRGYAALRAGHGEQALELHTRALAEAEAIFGPDSTQLAHAHDFLAATHAGLGQVAQAREHERHAIELLEAKHGPSHLELAARLHSGGELMLMIGERDEGRALLERAHALLLEQLGPEHQRTRTAARSLARYWFDEGRPERVAALLGPDENPKAEQAEQSAGPRGPIHLHPQIELAQAELACDAGAWAQARAGLERLADTDDLPLRVAALDLEGRLALGDPSIGDGAARARLIAESIELLALALSQPRWRVRAASLRVAADLREGVDEPRHREQLASLLDELPGLAADLRARARLLLWRATPSDEAAEAAALTALAQAFGPEHPLRRAN